jgi:uncharacterized protein with NAD-binding domain and iron-sulfur cluster
VSAPKPRIAILGGGTGGVTTALQLATPDWTDHFESITLYQQGWRLGGKGACGRGENRRIEEHGLHIWFGFYENSFRLLNRCHQELDRLQDEEGEARWNLPFKSAEESFSRLADPAVADHDGCSWKLWPADFFDEYDDRPWDPPGEGIPRDWTAFFYIERCLRLAADFAWSLVRSDPELEIVSRPVAMARAGADDIDDAIDAVLTAMRGDLRRLLGATADLVDQLAGEAADDPAVLDVLGLIVRAIDVFVEFLRRQEDELVRASDTVRRAFYIVDLMIAIVRGVIEDGIVEAGSFDVVDDVDLRDWLLAHGARQETVNCALIRALVYDLAFAYEGGDPQYPACGAGTALRGLLRAFFTYRGSLMWRMNSGMGDVVFLPFYELLVKRGVDVRFFHRVEALHVAGDLIAEIEIDVQAEVPPDVTPKDFARAEPGSTGPAGEDAGLAWPSDPSGIVSGAVSQSGSASEYESWYAGRANTHFATQVLKRESEFDLVVFAVPISCVPNVAPELITASARWADAVDYIRTVPTQAMQLWLEKPVEDVAPGTVLSGFVEPFDTWADMHQLVTQEEVPGSATVAYFCNVLADAPPPQRGNAEQWLADQLELVRFQARRFLSGDIADIWPESVNKITREFNWDLLVSPAGHTGADRLSDQYLRANVEPSERYVLSVPGSSEYRFLPDDTGFDNLYAVGDWTECGLNAGCVEAAVISGMVAANAIHMAYGDPKNVNEVIGFEGLQEGAADGG